MKLQFRILPERLKIQAGISLVPFNGLPVDNQLPGAVPVIKLLETNHEGDTVWMHLSKKMNSPSAHTNDFIINREGMGDIPVVTANVLENDSTVIVLLPAEQDLL